jgi:hypothetical protein
VIQKVYNGRNKFFFFYAHEYRPQTVLANGDGIVRLHLPAQAERQGDFSQSRDQNGNLIASIIDNTTGQAFPGNTIRSAGCMLAASRFSINTRCQMSRRVRARTTTTSRIREPIIS